jgi:hypothetical protein
MLSDIPAILFPDPFEGFPSYVWGISLMRLGDFPQFSFSGFFSEEVLFLIIKWRYTGWTPGFNWGGEWNNGRRKTNVKIVLRSMVFTLGNAQ